MSKHSPGPWRRDTTGGMKGDVRAANGRWVALCYGIGNQTGCYSEKFTRAVNDANARLIAAAPEMLALLRRVMASDQRVYDEIAALLARIDGDEEAAK